MEKSRQKLYLQIGNLLAPIFCGIIGAFATIGVDTSSVFSDDSYQKILSPAGFTFAIWGPIFFFLGLFYFYQARDLLRPESEKVEMPYVHQVSVFFILSTAATTAWYVLWARDLVWPAVAAMAVYLVTILGAYLRLGINRVDRPLKELVYVTTGWSLYAGWVTAALIVNTTTGLVSIGFDGPIIGEVGWTILVLAMTLVIYLAVLFTRNDYIFAGVGAWAVFGVLVETLNPVNTPYPEVTLVSALGVVVLIVAVMGWGWTQKRRGNLTVFTKLRDNT